MSGPQTIVLAPYDAALAADIARAAPDYRAVPLDALPSMQGHVAFVVDWLLPELSGAEFCRRLRADPRLAGSRIYIVIEDEDRETRRAVLKAGADDYMVGPLTAAKLLARVGATSFSSPAERKVLVNGPLRLDREAYQVRVGGSHVPLPRTEFKLLEFFLENPDRVLSRRELVGALKGEDRVYERTVDRWIGRLRQALAAAHVTVPIRTVRELGYVYDSY